MEAKDWYKVVNSQCKDLSLKYGVPLQVVVGVVVSLSAQNTWRNNFIQASEYLLYGKPKTGMFSGAQVKACDRIFAGENPLDVWAKTSFKYRNFYRSILLENGAICVDSHMINLYLKEHPFSGLHRFNKNQIFMSDKLYSIVQKWISKKSKENNLLTFEMQAQLWVEHRGEMF